MVTFSSNWSLSVLVQSNLKIGQRWSAIALMRLSLRTTGLKSYLENDVIAERVLDALDHVFSLGFGQIDRS